MFYILENQEIAMTNKLIDPTLGTVLRSLRKSKGCTLKEAAGQSFSSTHLSNFESGKTELSAPLLLKLLENINVSMIEFQRFYENYLRSQLSRPFSNEEVSEAYMTGNIVRLENILSALELRQDTKSSKHLKLEVIRIKAVISLLDKTKPLSENDSFFLKSYLSQLKEWGKYDIALFGQTYTNLDLDTLASLTDRMLNPSQLTITLESNQHALIQTVLNIMTFFIENKQFDRANGLITYLKNLKIHEYYMFEKLFLVYNTATMDYKLGDPSALNTLKKCQEVLEFCGCLNYANIFSKEISDLQIHN